jgi:hypothetical protein
LPVAVSSITGTPSIFSTFDVPSSCDEEARHGAVVWLGGVCEQPLPIAADASEPLSTFTPLTLSGPTPPSVSAPPPVGG